MRTARTDPADAPAGYQRWAVGNGAALLLPTRAVDTLLVERQEQARTAVLGSERKPEPRQVDKPRP